MSQNQILIHRQSTSRYRTLIREQSGSHGPFEAEIRSLGMTPKSETEISYVTPSSEVAHALGLAEAPRVPVRPDDTSTWPMVLRRKRRMYANDVPVQLATSYIPAEIARGTDLEQLDTGPGGILSRLADLGFQQSRITETLRVRKPSEEEREFFILEEHDPVVGIFHTGYTAGGWPVEVCVHAIPAYQWSLSYDWPIDLPIT